MFTRSSHIGIDLMCIVREVLSLVIVELEADRSVGRSCATSPLSVVASVGRSRSRKLISWIESSALYQCWLTALRNEGGDE